MNEEDLINKLEHDKELGIISDKEAQEIYRESAFENGIESKFN